MAGGPYNVPISDRERRPGSARRRDGDVQSGGGTGAGRAGGQLHAAGRRDGQLHPADRRDGGRVDITITRTGDTVGASGAGMLAAMVFDAVAAGTSPITVSGAATAPGWRRYRRCSSPRPRWWSGGSEAPVRRWIGQAMDVRRAGGYSFVELLVVTTIILILASAVHAAGPGDDPAEARSRAAARAARDADGDRQVQGRGGPGQIGGTDVKAGSEGYPPTCRRWSTA